jgi:hypothetical protein
LDANTGQQTNKTINGKLVTVTFSTYGMSGGVHDALYFMIDNGTTAYEISTDRPLSATPQVLPDYIQQIMTSARLIVPSSSPLQQHELQQSLPPLPQQPQSQQQGQQQQLQQTQAVSVSIVPGSSSLTDTAFQPNPVQVSASSFGCTYAHSIAFNFCHYTSNL